MCKEGSRYLSSSIVSGGSCPATRASNDTVAADIAAAASDPMPAGDPDLVA